MSIKINPQQCWLNFFFTLAASVVTAQWAVEGLSYALGQLVWGLGRWGGLDTLGVAVAGRSAVTRSRLKRDICVGNSWL